MDTVNCAMLERRSYWQDHVEQWQHSGLTQVAYCRQQGLKVAQFSYWKKRLRPAPSPGTTGGAADFIAVQMAGASAALVVVLNEHLRVEVRPGFDSATLRAVVQALSLDVPA